jgi:hypothetical protein
MAKTVATIVGVDRPNKTIIFDSKSSGSRYDKKRRKRRKGTSEMNPTTPHYTGTQRE